MADDESTALSFRYSVKRLKFKPVSFSVQFITMFHYGTD